MLNSRRCAGADARLSKFDRQPLTTQFGRSVSSAMWDFLRDRFNDVPRQLRPLFVIAFLLVALNRLGKIELQPQLEGCVSQPGIAVCVLLVIAAAPYAVLALGILRWILSGVVSRIRR